MSDNLPRAVLLELLADVLRDNQPPTSQAKYEYRKYAEVIARALDQISLEITSSRASQVRGGGLEGLLRSIATSKCLIVARTAGKGRAEVAVWNGEAAASRPPDVSLAIYPEVF